MYNSTRTISILYTSILVAVFQRKNHTCYKQSQEPQHPKILGYFIALTYTLPAILILTESKLITSKSYKCGNVTHECVTSLSTKLKAIKYMCSLVRLSPSSFFVCIFLSKNHEFRPWTRASQQSTKQRNY